MDKRFLRVALALACLCGAASAASAQQPQGRRGGGGGLDNMSLPSTLERAAAAERWPTFAPGKVSVAMPATRGRGAEKRGRAADRAARIYRVRPTALYDVTHARADSAALFDMKGFEQDLLASLAGSSGRRATSGRT